MGLDFQINHKISALVFVTWLSDSSKISLCFCSSHNKRVSCRSVGLWIRLIFYLLCYALLWWFSKPFFLKIAKTKILGYWIWIINRIHCGFNRFSSVNFAHVNFHPILTLSLPIVKDYCQNPISPSPSYISGTSRMLKALAEKL